MLIEKLNLLNFKNYDEAELIFSPQINIFSGLNGSGKTNLLDAIHYISLSKSAFNISDASSIRHGENFFSISSKIMRKEEPHLIQCIFYAGQKKIMKLDKTPYEKITDHIGRFPVVLITPNDTDIIREGSEERRKFFDSLISQLDKNYLSALIRYNQILKQRNSLLKQFFERKYKDLDLLDTYSKQLIDLSVEIYSVRESFLREFLPVFLSHYKNLAGEAEPVSLDYESTAGEKNFGKYFQEALEKDLALQRTTRGIHRDDFIFKIKELPLKTHGSQGQQKSFVVALKLAQFEVIKNKTEVKPALLLDDIFDKLDEERIGKLMQMVADNTFGQLFITDARIERTDRFLRQLNREIRIFKIQSGKITVVSS